MEPDGLEVSSKPAMLAASGPQSSACPSDSPGQEQSCQSGSGSISKSAPTPIKPVKQLDKRLIGVLLVAPFVLYICTFFLLPLISVVSMSTHSINDDYMLTNIRTLSNFRSVVNAENLPVLLRSAKYALCTTCLCLFLGYPLAWYIARYGGRYKPVLLILVMLPFWTSYLIRIFAWMTILQTEGLLNTLLLNIGLISQPLDMLNTPFSVILGLTYGFLPFAILPLYVSLEKLDDSLMEAAADSRAFEGLRGAIFFAKRHESGHLVFREHNLLASPVGKGHIRDFIRQFFSHFAPVLIRRYRRASRALTNAVNYTSSRRP